MSAVIVERPLQNGELRGASEVVPNLWTTGLDVLLHQFRHPEEMFGEASAVRASCRYPAIDAAMTEELRQYFERSERRCMDAYARLRVAATIPGGHDIRVCGGPLEVRIWYDDCDDCYVEIIVSVDADAEQARQLNEELLRQTVVCSIHSAYLDLKFESVHAPAPAGWIGRPAIDLFVDTDVE